MFLDALSISLLQLCETEGLSYEEAAHRSDLSSQYFGRIVRRKSSPTLLYLEKLCTGFHRTPNELLRIEPFHEELLYRTPMAVTEVCVLPASQLSFPVCPRCKRTFEREYQAYCDRCGQRLLWKGFHKAAITIVP